MHSSASKSQAFPPTIPSKIHVPSIFEETLASMRITEQGMIRNVIQKEKVIPEIYQCLRDFEKDSAQPFHEKEFVRYFIQKCIASKKRLGPIHKFLFNFQHSLDHLAEVDEEVRFVKAQFFDKNPSTAEVSFFNRVSAKAKRFATLLNAKTNKNKLVGEILTETSIPADRWVDFMFQIFEYSQEVLDKMKLKMATPFGTKKSNSVTLFAIVSQLLLFMTVGIDGKPLKIISSHKTKKKFDEKEEEKRRNEIKIKMSSLKRGGLPKKEENENLEKIEHKPEIIHKKDQSPLRPAENLLLNQESKEKPSKSAEKSPKPINHLSITNSPKTKSSVSPEKSPNKKSIISPGPKKPETRHPGKQVVINDSRSYSPKRSRREFAEKSEKIAQMQNNFYKVSDLTGSIWIPKFSAPEIKKLNHQKEKIEAKYPVKRTYMEQEYGNAMTIDKFSRLSHRHGTPGKYDSDSEEEKGVEALRREVLLLEKMKFKEIKEAEAWEQRFNSLFDVSNKGIEGLEENANLITVCRQIVVCVKSPLENDEKYKHILAKLEDKFFKEVFFWRLLEVTIYAFLKSKVLSLPEEKLKRKLLISDFLLPKKEKELTFADVKNQFVQMIEALQKNYGKEDFVGPYKKKTIYGSDRRGRWANDISKVEFQSNTGGRIDLEKLRKKKFPRSQSPNRQSQGSAEKDTLNSGEKRNIFTSDFTQKMQKRPSLLNPMGFSVKKEPGVSKPSSFTANLLRATNKPQNDDSDDESMEEEESGNEESVGEN